ncbi:MAG: putative signal peptide protein [Paucimonas sp.]|nr:putative signal peptide protein [Paucimonas sp.]
MQASRQGWRRLLAIASLVLCSAAPSAWAANGAQADSAPLLRQKYQALKENLGANQFGRPLHLESVETPSSLEGDIFARIDHPFPALRAALSRPEGWCEVLILHINVKYCRVPGDAAPARLLVKAGRKEFQSLERAHTALFRFNLDAAEASWFQASLAAPTGPLGTRNYKVLVSAIPLSANQAFLHLRYSYEFGNIGAMAMSAYLGSAGRDKVGFTIVGRDAEGKPEYIKGPRGIVERNAMRYYLAIDAVLGALGLPPQQQQQARLATWFAGTEQYALQLHELPRADYFDIKRRELARQQEVAPETIE